MILTYLNIIKNVFQHYDCNIISTIITQQLFKKFTSNEDKLKQKKE